MAKQKPDPADELRAFGLEYPGAHLKSPWPGHADLAVNDKTFAYLNTSGNPFSISCKLPHSADQALDLPFTEPTSYGLGKWGWVTATPDASTAPLELFKAWIDESYRSQAPKRLVAQLASPPQPAAATTATAKRGKSGTSAKDRSTAPKDSARRTGATARATKSAPQKASRRATPSSAATTSPARTSGYSGTPLPKKLGIKAGHRVAILKAPLSFADLLVPLPEAVHVTQRLGATTQHDVLVYFTKRREELEKRFSRLIQAMTSAAGLWVAWPKRASGVATDITEDTVRELALARGLVDNKVCAIDETWSGLRCVIRVENRPQHERTRRAGP